jgi:hypothetical protein
MTRRDFPTAGSTLVYVGFDRVDHPLPGAGLWNLWAVCPCACDWHWRGFRDRLAITTLAVCL